MKILHLISQHPEDTGSGIYLQNIIRQAEAFGHENFLVAGISGNHFPLLDGIAPDACRPVRFESGPLDFTIPGMSDVMPYPSMRYRDLSAAQLAAYDRAFTETIRTAVRDFSPDILHSHHLWLASSAARRVLPDIPMVTSCHSTELRQFQQCPHLQEMVLQPCRNIDRVLALSLNQVRDINSLYGIPVHRVDVVGGGYDTEVFRFTEKKQVPPVNLLYAGKLSFAKGIDWLLRTFINLGDHNLHLHLAGSGSGEEAQRCLELAQKAGAGVTVHGRISQPELAGLMARCHIFILPSFFEGLPLVILEALASGCRVITTDLPGCVDILTKEESDLVAYIHLPEMVEVDRPDEKHWSALEGQLATAITNMANRVRRAPSPSTREIFRITSDYSWQAVFTRTLRSYEKAMAG